MSDSQLIQKKGAAILQPKSGEVSYFTDSTGTLKQVDSSGNVTAVGGGVTPATDFYTALAAPATQLDSPAISGNTSGDFLLDVGILTSSGGGGQNLSILLNGAATNILAYATDGKTFGGQSRTDLMFANTGPYGFFAGVHFSFMGRISARTGRRRQISVRGYVDDTNAEYLAIDGQWTDTTTNLIKVSILAGNANGLAIGSYIRLTPLNTNA